MPQYDILTFKGSSFIKTHHYLKNSFGYFLQQK